MIRKTLIDLLEISRSVKEAFNAACYEVNDYNDGSFVEIRLQKIRNVDNLTKLTQGFDVNLYPSEGYIIVRIHENYKGE